MNEQDVRALVRAAVARHLDAAAMASPSATACATPPSVHVATAHGPAPSVSHALFTGLVNVTDACVIEPAVQCDHCGYCKSQGY
jgi:hypothetical protein